ncbi:MAG TPA: hypothetical protein VFK02_29950 [Kofleriaceae bacterium]|nr:hypothetical protein [Kofleriaceae bacterium]
MALIAGCQGKSEPDPPRSPPPIIEARAAGTTIARIVAGHPCRADIDGNELLVGTEPLVTQVGNNRWTGDDGPDGTTLRRDGAVITRLADTRDRGVEVFDARGSVLLQIAADGTISNARGEVLRRAEPSRLAIKIGDAIVTGTSDVPLGVILSAPELIPEVRALAVCHRLSVSRGAPGAPQDAPARDQAARK